MAYRNLTLSNIAGEITATYNDNNMSQASNTLPSGDGIMLTATALSGLEGQSFQVLSGELTRTMSEFNSGSDIAKTLTAAKLMASENTPISVMRIGAKPFHYIIEKATAGMHEKETWIRITPYLTRETDTAADIKSTTDQLGLILMPFREGSLIRQRVILFNIDTATVLFDSEGIFANPEAESIFDVSINVPAGMFLWTPNAFAANTLNSVTEQNIYDLAAISGGLQTSAGLTLGDITPDNAGDVAFETKINVVDQFALTNQTLKAYNALNATAKFSLDYLAGANGDFIDHCERYAANEIAYKELEFENFSFLHCDKCYADIEAVNLTESMSLNDQLTWQKNSLGYLWKYEFNGRPYVFMSRSLNPFSSSLVTDEYVYDGITYKASADQQKVGDLLNLVEFHLHPKATGSATDVESFFNAKGLIECHVEFDCDPANATDARGRTKAQFDLLGEYNDTNEDGVSADDVTGLNQADHTAYVNAGWIEAVGTITLQTPFCELQLDVTKFDAGDEEYIVRYRPSLVGASRSLSEYCLNNAARLSTESDAFFMTHYNLTQNVIPEAVMSRLLTFVDPVYNGATLTAETGSVTLVASDVEVREVSFLHQAATAAYVASTNYNQTIAILPTTAPARGRNGVSEWAGNPATYTVQSNGDVLVTKNGTGVLGTKLIAGAVGYRGSSAFGGIILTNGDSLPNGIPYGIDDTDEALDAMGNPIDLGKHAVIVGAYGLIDDPKIAFGQNKKKIRITSERPYLGNAAPIIAGVLANQEPGTEPIGPIRGRLNGFNTQQRTPRAVLDNLAALRICMIDQTGVISSIYTSALRTSDYTKISSLLASNAILRRLRAECSNVIGSAYTDAEISSLQSRLDGVSRALVAQGYAQNLSVQMRASQLDRVNGVLRLNVTFIPPLSIEAINVELTLEPPASGI